MCAARGGTVKTSTRIRAARSAVHPQHPGIWFWRPGAKTPPYFLSIIFYLLSAKQQPLSASCQLSVFIDPASFFRHGVKAEFAERVAAQNAPQRQKQALDDAVGLQRLNGVVAAGRDKPAMPGRMRADVLLVKADQRHQQPGHGAAGGTGAALSGRPALANSLPSVLLSCVLFKRGV